MSGRRGSRAGMQTGPVSFWQWYVRRGRIDRRTWWLHYTAPVTALTVLALFADLSLGNVDLAAATTGGSLYGPLVVTTVLLTAPPSISGSVARLHDKGLPAWWLLIALVPYVGSVALFVLSGFVRGDRGPNRYGLPAGPAFGPAADPLYVPPTWG